jgi:hypothetical protein
MPLMAKFHHAGYGAAAGMENHAGAQRYGAYAGRLRRDDA